MQLETVLGREKKRNTQNTTRTNEGQEEQTKKALLTFYYLSE